MSRHRRRDRYTSILVLSLAVIFYLVVLGMTGAVVYASRSQSEIYISWMEPDGDVQIGALSGPADRRTELGDTVWESPLTFATNTTPSMKDGRSTANLMVENPPENINRFTVVIRRDDTGGEVYKSDCLGPEQHIEEVLLDQELPTGEYVYAAWFDAYRINDSAYISRAAARIKLCVQNRWPDISIRNIRKNREDTRRQEE